MIKIYVIGSDSRQTAIREIINQKKVNCENIHDANIVIGSTPFTKDGMINGTECTLEEYISKFHGKKIYAGSIKEAEMLLLENSKISYVDFMKNDSLAIKNAVPTAEGVVPLIHELTRKTVFNQNILILGFGKVGKVLANRLKGLQANVFCEARNEKDLAFIYSLGYNVINIQKICDFLPKMDVVINTVPSLILDDKKISKLRKEAVIIDLASFPGGTDFEYAKRSGITAVLSLGLPAKVAPRSSGEYIADFVFKEENI